MPAYGLIRTAKLHGLDPYNYYVALLKAIPHCESIEDYERLLPWNIFSYTIAISSINDRIPTKLEPQIIDRLRTGTHKSAPISISDNGTIIVDL